MRILLASTGLGALAATLSTPAVAETVIGTATTTPVATSSSGDIRITVAGSIKPTGGAAVTIDSNNSVKNESGGIAIKGANGSTGILANTNLSGGITNGGSIIVDEDFTPTDTDNDGDLDGPFAQGTNRFGIHVLGGGTFTGAIANSGSITVEGNQSAGIAVDSALTGSLTSTGSVSVLGDESVGIRTGAVSGSVTIGSGSTTNVQGHNSVGVLLGGNIGGALVIQGSVSATGYRSVVAPADPSKLDSDDLLQGGSAVVVGGNVTGGILLDTKPADTDPNNADEDHDGTPDANETTATISSFGAAPAMAIGSTSQDIAIGAVSSSPFGLVIKGSVAGNGVYSGITATGLSVGGGAGHTVNIAGGMTVAGTVSAKATGASATAIHIGAGATVPQIAVSGTVSANGGGTDTSSAQAIAIDSGATVTSLTNSGTIAATRSGTAGTAAAIVDRSGKLALVQNSGAIGVTNSDLGDKGVAIDLGANTTGAVIRQVAAATGAAAPVIAGNILLGTGNDTLDVQAGNVFGKVDFGGGNDILALSGTSVFRGTLANSNGLAVTVGSGSTLDVKNLESVNLASLTTASGASLGVTIGDTGNTLYNVAGTASFATGSKILVTLDHVGTAGGTFTIIDAGTLTGADNLSSSIVTLPFLFDSTLTPDIGTGEVKLTIGRKSADQLGLNASETAILDAAIAAADSDRSIASVFLATDNSATLKNTLQQLMPDHAGGAFEAATKGSRLAAGILSDPRRIPGFWAQEITWGSSKSIGDTASYDITGWGVTGGYELPVGPIGNVGLTGAFLFGKDGKDNNDLSSNHYEGGVYWRGGTGPLRAYARGTIGTIDFKSTRRFSAALDGSPVERSADGKWNGHLYSGTAGLSYEALMGRLSLRPNALVEYYKLKEKGYAETGGGTAFDLTVQGRDSDEAAAQAMLTAGYDFLGRDPRDPDESWARIEIEGGRREIFSRSLGTTTASFADGDPFTLTPEDRTSGWRGGMRVLAGGPSMTFVAEVNAEEQQSKASLGGRIAVGIAF